MGEINFEEVRRFSTECDASNYIIDVREPSELEKTGIIPKSINISLCELQQALEKLSEQEFLDRYGRNKPDKQSSTIIYSCLSGRRSKQAVEITKQLGYQNVKSFSGGWSEWEKKSTAEPQ
ncbi:unnamed protein product [Acanthoscelides obtectus]|uniref:Rhodanese domain-containing protein n=1 Tax=Acanthoscelides obtectus TaxID=200917 RepID=A0A9P0KRS9_ACAOB|nr:unnamed protein product [Acanthoscelides obtectus]CAK1677382.1 Rhodanese domain-containing protein CG4456 [Acanthoscelides obtectus]